MGQSTGYLILILILASSAYATNEKDDLCNSNLKNLDNILYFKPRNKSQSPKKEIVAIGPSAAGLSFNQFLSDLLKSYEILNTRKNGSSILSYFAVIHLARGEHKILISNSKNAEEYLHMDIPNRGRIEASVKEDGDTYTYSRQDGNFQNVVKVETDILSGEKILLIYRSSHDNSAVAQFFRIRLKERKTGEQIGDASGRASRQVQKILGDLFLNYSFSVLDDHNLTDLNLRFESYVKGTFISILIKSALTHQNIFALSFNGLNSQKEKVSLRIINGVTVFSVYRDEAVGVLSEYEVKIDDLSHDKNRLMTVSKMVLNVFSGTQTREKRNILLTPVAVKEETSSDKQGLAEPISYRGASDSGKKLIELLKKLKTNYVLGETRKTGEAFTTFLTELDVKADAVWSSITPIAEGARPDWQHYTKPTDVGSEFSLNQVGEDFIYIAKKNSNNSPYYYEISTASDLNTGAKYLVFSSGWIGDEEGAKTFRVALEPKRNLSSSSENKKLKSQKANEDFQTRFTELEENYKFIPLDEGGREDQTRKFTVDSGGGNLRIQLDGQGGRSTLFAEDINSDSTALGSAIETYFIDERNSIIHGTYIKMFGGVQYRLIRIDPVKGSYNEIMRLSVKIPRRSLGKYLDRTYSVLVVPK
jgi:hypothetical protein